MEFFGSSSRRGRRDCAYIARGERARLVALKKGALYLHIFYLREITSREKLYFSRFNLAVIIPSYYLSPPIVSHEIIINFVKALLPCNILAEGISDI